jgi:predicted acetyltransferase
MSKEFTEKDYKAFMRMINEYIKKAEMVINELPRFKEASKLSYEDWVKWQSGEYKIKKDEQPK